MVKGTKIECMSVLYQLNNYKYGNLICEHSKFIKVYNDIMGKSTKKIIIIIKCSLFKMYELNEKNEKM